MQTMHGFFLRTKKTDGMLKEISKRPIKTTLNGTLLRAAIEC